MPKNSTHATAPATNSVIVRPPERLGRKPDHVITSGAMTIVPTTLAIIQTRNVRATGSDPAASAPCRRKHGAESDEHERSRKQARRARADFRAGSARARARRRRTRRRAPSTLRSPRSRRASKMREIAEQEREGGGAERRAAEDPAPHCRAGRRAAIRERGRSRARRSRRRPATNASDDERPPSAKIGGGDGNDDDRCASRSPPVGARRKVFSHPREPRFEPRLDRGPLAVDDRIRSPCCASCRPA